MGPFWLVLANFPDLPFLIRFKYFIKKQLVLVKKGGCKPSLFSIPLVVFLHQKSAGGPKRLPERLQSAGAQKRLSDRFSKRGSRFSIFHKYFAILLKKHFWSPKNTRCLFPLGRPHCFWLEISTPQKLLCRLKI